MKQALKQTNTFEMSNYILNWYILIFIIQFDIYGRYNHYLDESEARISQLHNVCKERNIDFFHIDNSK